MFDFDAFFRDLLDQDRDVDFVARVAAAAGLSRDGLYNVVALEIARRFDAAKMTYDEADLAMSQVWSLMIDDAAQHGDRFVLAEPAFAIYEAFDAGEYDRSDGSDPVEQFTRPTIRRILSQF